MRVHLAQGHRGFGFHDRVVDREVGAQTVPVLHQDVSAKTQPGGLAVGLAIEDALRIGRALVGVVAAFLPAKVHARVARVVVLDRLDLLGIRPVLADKALETRPRLDERAIRGEMRVARPPFLPREVIDFGEEELGHGGGEDALVVLGEDPGVEAALTEFAIQKSEPEQIVAELFAEEPFAADGIERGQHARLEQLFRRNAGASQRLVEFVQERRALLQDRVHPPLDAAQRMIRRHAGIEVDHGQEVGLGLRSSAHVSLTYHRGPYSNSRGDSFTNFLGSFSLCQSETVSVAVVALALNTFQ